MYQNNRKSQVTIFIILGVIILIAIGLFVYYRAVLIPKEKTVIEEIAPVKDYIDSCISMIGKDGLDTLGLNGGFIYFPPEIDSKPYSYLATSPIKELKNPYWWYDGINNTPTLEFMREELSKYANDNIKECLGDFDALNDDFEIKEMGELSAVAKINENDVTFDVKYPIQIISRQNATKTRKNKFKITLPVRLKKMHELANAIMGSQYREAFIEKKAMDLIVLDNDIPTTDVEISCKKKTWNVEEVRNKLKRLLSVNIPYIRVANTNYDTTIFVPNPDEKDETYKNSYYNYHYIWSATDVKYPETHVGFTYDPKWETSFRAFPSDGRTMQSNGQKGTEMLSSLCLHIWHFTYDVGFPVKVTISDEKTSGHDEYTFIFAFKASINHNKPDRINRLSQGYTSRDIIRDEEFCSDTSNDITIIPEDSVEKISVSDVNVTFICGGYECDLGTVERDYNSGGEAFMTKKVPYCVAGYIKTKGENYIDAEIPVQTDRERSYTVSLTPIRAFLNYKVVKHSFNSNNIQSANSNNNIPAGTYSVGEAEEFASNERATITVSKKDEDFESYGVYPDNMFPIKILDKKDDVYDVSVYLLRDEEIVGGYVGELNVQASELINSDEIIFHVIELNPLPKDETEKFLFIGGLPTYSKNAPSPEIK